MIVSPRITPSFPFWSQPIVALAIHAFVFPCLLPHRGHASPPPLPIPQQGVLIYHGLPSGGYPQNENAPYSYGGETSDVAVGIGPELNGEPWGGYSYYTPNNYGGEPNWVYYQKSAARVDFLSPPKFPDFQSPPSAEQFPLLGAKRAYDNSFFPDVFDFSEPVYVANDSVLIGAQYGASGLYEAGNSSQGFILAIAVSDNTYVEIAYDLPPQLPANIVGSFSLPLSGEAVILAPGTHYFGVLAAYPNFPADPTSPSPWNPIRSGSDRFKILIHVGTYGPPTGADNRPPSITQFSRSATNTQIQWSWSDVLNRSVLVQRRTSLASGAWETIGSGLHLPTFTDTNAPTGSAFYRLAVPRYKLLQ